MKKVLTTATAIVFALGLTAAAQATPEKAKTGAEPKVTTTQMHQTHEVGKPKDQKVAASEAKPAETSGKEMGSEASQKEVTPPSTAKPEKGKEVKPDTGQEAKTGQPDKKAAPEAPKPEKK